MKPSQVIEEMAPKQKFRPPRAGMGRPKGVGNKTTRSVKEAITMAADKLGGVDRLVEWAKENPDNERLFWGTIYPKLLPYQVNATVQAEPGYKFTIQKIASRIIDLEEMADNSDSDQTD